MSTGSNAQFPVVTYSPSSFVAEPGQTTTVSVTTQLRGGLGPGVYLLPARVTPLPGPGTGNIRIRESVVALVTFQVPGATNAHAVASFVPPPARRNIAPVHSFGNVTVELAPSGRAVLQVVDASGTSLLAYTETTASQQPFGHVVFSGHTPNEPNDVRTSTELFFAGHYRDYPLSWTASPAGLGLAQVHGFVSYQPGPGRLVSISATTRVLLISPWWEFFPLSVIAAAALVLRRRIRRRRNAPGTGDRGSSITRIVGRTLTSLLLVGLLTLPALMSRPLALAVGCTPAALCGLWAVLSGRGRSGRTVPFVGQLVTAGLLITSAVGVVLAGRVLLAADISLAGVVGAGAAGLATWWSSWFIRPRKSPRHLRSGSRTPEPAGANS